MNEHTIYEATVRQIAGLELEREAHLVQIKALVAERDALRIEVAELRIFGATCDRTGCEKAPTVYIVKQAGAVHLCAEHAREEAAERALLAEAATYIMRRIERALYLELGSISADDAADLLAKHTPEIVKRLRAAAQGGTR